MPANNESHRKLAAILSADVVGYSRLMEADEPATVETLKTYRAAVRSGVQQHHGRVVNAPGDAILAEFPSAVEAVRCAAELQQDLRERDTALPPERRMQYRIGVNLGDVIEETDGTLYGDGVNIAARLEGLAEAGGVCVSGSVYDAVEGKLDLAFDSLGEQHVKNITKPLRVYRLRSQTTARISWPTWRRSRALRIALLGIAALVLVAVAAGVAWQVTRPSPASDPVLALPKGPSIAVLPFTNLSGDPKEEYFADGITEEIITQLTQFRELFVIARNTTFQHKGQAVDVKKLGRELGVRYVLEGSVRRAGGRIRVTAQLLDASSGTHLWAETYDRKLLTAGDLLGVQDDITGHVVAKIADAYGVISRARFREAQTKGTDNLAAYECVLEARENWASPSPTAQQRARACLERTTAVDQTYAEGWAWLAFTYLNEYLFDFVCVDQPCVRDPVDRALMAGRRAVAIDPEAQTPHYALAYIYFARREVAQFHAEAEQAIAINPNNTLVLADLGNLISGAGDYERGMVLTRKAMALNPRFPGWYYEPIFRYHYRRGEYEKALDAAHKWNQPEFFWNQVHLAQAYAQLGRKKEAQAAVAKLLQLYPEFPRNVWKEFRKWELQDDMIELYVDGLRKAGLDIPPE